MAKRTRQSWIGPVLLALIAVFVCFSFPPPSFSDTLPLNPDPPASPVKLIFVHHSTGENWLHDDNGGLGKSLKNSNYFVSDTNYDWGPTDPDLGYFIGSNTDIGHWWNWFVGTGSVTNTAALYVEYGQHSSYSRLDTDPGGENEVIMFKSCFPNSALQGNPDDPATTGDNPLRGQGSGSDHHTVGNAKGIYNDLLTYFATRQDKLFVAIAAPPLSDSTYAANARAFNEWLFNDWLKDYPHRNVAVYDFYNVLTSNGGSANTNDTGAEGGNHHRWRNSTVQHKSDAGSNTLAYPTGDDHPSKAGNQKATTEFGPVLNVFYHCWKGTGGCPTAGECVYTAGRTGKAVPHAGGSFATIVRASGKASCPIPTVTAPDWLTAAVKGYKKNKGTLKVKVPENPGSTDRSGDVFIDDFTLTITQTASPCRIKPLVPDHAPLQRTGGDGVVTVRAIEGCGWTVTQDDASTSWLHIGSALTGTGPGTVQYTVDEHPTGAHRTGKITLTLTPGTQKRVFTVKQK